MKHTNYVLGLGLIVGSLAAVSGCSDDDENEHHEEAGAAGAFFTGGTGGVGGTGGQATGGEAGEETGGTGGTAGEETGGTGGRTGGTGGATGGEAGEETGGTGGTAGEAGAAGMMTGGTAGEAGTPMAGAAGTPPVAGAAGMAGVPVAGSGGEAGMAGGAPIAGAAGMAGAPAFWPAAYVADTLPTPEDGEHNAGEDCLTCHVDGGAAEDDPWLFAGTVYQEDGTTGAASVEVGVGDGTVTYTTYSAENGNFWVPLDSNSLVWGDAVAKIRNADGERTMSSVPLEGCNSCHTAGNVLIEPQP